MTLNEIYQILLAGDLSVMTPEVIMYINDRTCQIIESQKNTMILNNIMDTATINEMEMIILISNVIYNNTDCVLLPLEDEVYDMLQNIYKVYFPNSYKIGAPPVNFGSTEQNFLDNSEPKTVFPFKVPELKRSDMMFPDTFYNRYNIMYANELNDSYEVSKRLRQVQHLHPSLAGTLDKCNFVLIEDAVNKGIDVKKDLTTQIFERDFMQKNANLFGLNLIPMVVMIKYDGVAIEADCTNTIVAARTRGDTNANETTDITPILAGYEFPNAVPLDKPVGIQFEAIIDYYNLQKLNEITGKNYINGRTAIIGLLGRSDARKFRDFITLVPVDADIPNTNKIQRLEFCNQYYATRIKCDYQYFCSGYQDTLFLVHKFVYEAEHMRSWVPFMYDGVVCELIDPNAVQVLGRKNNVNKYMMAIKFNSATKFTRFLGYTFSVGQNGEIVPKLHYMPVSLMGTIHRKTTGHSFKRFMELGLKPNDIIQIEYRNDVIPYATKPNIPDNMYNPNEPIAFPTKCPCCGSPVYFSEKQAFCTWIHCPERTLARVTNMIAKLGIKDVSEERVKLLNINGFAQLMTLDSQTIYNALGEATGEKLIDQINNLKMKPINDYDVIGSIGFSNLAQKTWKLVLSQITLDELMYLNDISLYNRLITVKGIGDETVNTIKNQRGLFEPDIQFIINNMPNVVRTTGLAQKIDKVIKVTQFRFDDYQKSLILAYNPNVEIGEGNVTKNTDILIVPIEGFKNKKTETANRYGIPVIPVNAFLGNLSLYL